MNFPAEGRVPSSKSLLPNSVALRDLEDFMDVCVGKIALFLVAL